jgi:hypothetical protein
VIECELCGRRFQDSRAYDLHWSYDVKSGGVHVNNPEQAAAMYPERRRCGNHQELIGKGLTWHGWQSVTGPRDQFWSETVG